MGWSASGGTRWHRSTRERRGAAFLMRAFLIALHCANKVPWRDRPPPHPPTLPPSNARRSRGSGWMGHCCNGTCALSSTGGRGLSPATQGNASRELQSSLEGTLLQLVTRAEENALHPAIRLGQPILTADRRLVIHPL